MDKIGAEIATIIAGIIGLALAAVILSRNANTPGVIQSASSGLSSLIGAAVAPVSGSSGALPNMQTIGPYGQIG